MKRKIIILSLTTLLFSLFTFAQNISIQSEKDLVGIVSDGHKGIEGVVVSDGYTTTVTNKDGEYQLLRNKKAKFIFISTPENYQLSTEGSLPVQHKSINQEFDIVYANFQLIKAKIQNDFTLIAIADPQPSRDWEMKRFRDETIEDIKNLVKLSSTKTKFLGIAVGDLVWDAPDLYPSFVDAVNTLPFPLLPVIGNHDHDQKAVNNDYEAARNYEAYFGPTYYSYNKGKCHFIVLDDMIYHNRKKYDNEITKEQLEWLKEDLSYIDKNKLIVLGLHVPINFRGKELNNSNELYDILKDYNVVAISGHTHDGETSFINNKLTEYTLNAAFGTGWVGDIGRTGAPNGYAVFSIKGNKLDDQYYKSTGFSKEYQMKLYPPGAWKGKEESVIANIWSYNNKWKLEVFENDIKRDGLVQYNDFDPFAYEYMFGPKKPKHRPNTEPKKTNKLFHYTPLAKDSKVKIVATDEFGNRYISEIDLSINN